MTRQASASQATGRYAEVPPVFLHEDVEVLREASATQEELTLQTEYLRVVPDRDWSDTDRPVTIVSAHNTVHAVGLEMDNKAHTLKLLSQVRSVNVPTKK